MVFTICKELIPFMLMIFYFIFAVFVQAQILNPKESFNDQFFRVFLWVMIGGIDETDNRKFTYAPGVIVFGNVFIMVILVNFLTAQLSNKYTELEEKWKLNWIQDKAALVLDAQVIMFCFDFRKCGKGRIYPDEFHDCEHQSLVSSGETKDQKKPTPKKNLYILTNINFDSVDENCAEK